MNIVDTRPPTLDERELTLLVLLQRVWTYGFTTKSDYARVYADEISEAASRGYLTTEVIPGCGVFGRIWKLTPAGTLFLFANGHRISEKEVHAYVEEYVQGS